MKTALHNFFHPREFTGAHMLAIMVTAFGVIISVNVTMAVLANQTWTGLMAKNGYVASIDYANNARTRDKAAARGWSIDATLDGARPMLVFTDASGATVPATVTGTVQDAAQRGDTAPLTLTHQPRHGYTAADPLPAGRHIVGMTAVVGDERLTLRTVFEIE